MSILPIYLYGSEVLRKKAKPVSKVDDKLVKLIVDMFETMRHAQGIGLAANQVGRLERVLVFDVSEMEEMKNVPPMALINPEILEQEGSALMEEGCLSIPDVRDEVDRSLRIRVRYRDTNFEEHEFEAFDFLARVILHEVDHLNGVLFLDHLTKPKQKLHKDALKEIERGVTEAAYPVVTAKEAAKV